MSIRRENLHSFIEESDSMEMKEDQPDEDTLIKTQYIGSEVSDKQREINAHKKRLVEAFGSNDGCFKWMKLNDDSKLEKIKEFGHGGFADVTLHKFRKNGKLIIVKKNRMTGKNDNVVRTNTINEIKHMD